MTSPILEANIHRFAGGLEEDTVDTLAVEEPLEIRIGWMDNEKPVERPISITMRTPGSDEELALGFLFAESIIDAPSQVDHIRRVATSAKTETSRRSLPVTGRDRDSSNTIVVELQPGVGLDLKRLERHFYTTSSCGVCGKSSIEALRTTATPVTSDLTVESDVISSLPLTLREQQGVFDSTGGLHAAALFTSTGEMEILREDVGRHNAVDKVIGARFLSRATPVLDRLLLVSGRASFELVQKAVVAGIPVLAAVGAPSSLAVELAREFGMTLVGFVRDGRFNIYTGHQRILSATN